MKHRLLFLFFFCIVIFTISSISYVRGKEDDPVKDAASKVVEKKEKPEKTVSASKKK